MGCRKQVLSSGSESEREDNEVRHVAILSWNRRRDSRLTG